MQFDEKQKVFTNVTDKHLGAANADKEGIISEGNKQLYEYQKFSQGGNNTKQQFVQKEPIYEESESERDDDAVEKLKPFKRVEKVEHVAKKQQDIYELKQVLQILSDIYSMK